jgi:hypothetical protein
MHDAPGCHFNSEAEVIGAGDAWTGEFWATLTNSTIWTTRNVSRLVTMRVKHLR